MHTMHRFLHLAVILALAKFALAVTVTVSATASHPIPTTLWGQMFEDISSGDGGLYAELLQNRAFQQVTPGSSSSLAGWQAINGGGISVIRETVPVSTSLLNALRLVVPTGRTGAVGFSNTGFSGIKVVGGSRYTASFYFRFPTASSFNGNVVVGLQSTSGQVFASAATQISGSQTTWKQVTLTLTPNSSPSSTANIFTITLDGSGAAGQTINFAMLSLFPPTYKNRPNGMRVDIAEALAEMGPSFFRLPGGNNLEGQSTGNRWQWNATVGSLLNRPGRTGDWGYINTDGIGLLEYLNWCEDLNMEPLMAVWAGYSLGGTSLAENQLAPYVQQAIDQINFVVGDPAKSAPAALRASLGHPQPFKLNYVEIGNEDWFAASTYPYRWRSFATALKAQFPNIHFIATTYVNNPVLSPVPTEYDVHVYNTPSWFAQNAFYYDDFQRNGMKYFEGEYAAISTNPNDIYGQPANGRLTFPTMQSAAGEAAFMTGLERNSDIVFGASYAPLLGHVSNHQWTPNLVAFDASVVYRSTSFYVQKLFSLNRGDAYIPSTLPSRTGTLFWSITRKTSTNEIIIKIANTVGTAAPLTFVLPFATVSSTGTAQILTGASGASNSPTTPNAVTPANSTIATGKTFNFNAPAFSVSVLKLVAH